MKTVSLSGSLRENVGKKDAKYLRTQGLVPCVLYGGEKQVHFSLEEKTLKPLFETPEVCFVELEIAGDKYKTILQDAHFHKVTESLLHVDFFELKDTRPIIMAVPLVLKGSSPGVLKGGKMVKNKRKLKVKALPQDMPQEISIDISGLDVADQFRVKDIQVGNYEILEVASSAVVFVKSSRNMTADATAEAGK